MKMKIEDYKEQISIIEFIQFRKDLDFVLTRDWKHVKAYIPQRDNDGKIVYNGTSPVKKEHILIARIDANHHKRTKVPGNENLPVVINEVYFTVSDFDKSKPKSIIDFINDFVLRNNDKINFGHVIGVMEQYMKHKDFVALVNSSIDLKESKPSNGSNQSKPKKIKLDLPSENTFNYLKSRGIKSETYLSPMFIGTYGSIKSEDTFNKDRPAFPLFNEDGKIHTIQSIDFNGTTHNGKYMLKDIPRNSSLYQSNFIPKETNTIVMIESPEKAMAHYQLFKDELNSQRIRPFYNSSCGQFTANDLDVIRRHAAYKNIDNYIICFDNDKAGHVYTINTLLTLNYVLPSIKELTVNSENIHLVLGKNTEDIMKQKGINYKVENDLIIINDKTQNLFKKLQPDNVRVHSSITSDFLDDLNSNLKLPFQFKDNNKQYSI